MRFAPLLVGGGRAAHEEGDERRVAGSGGESERSERLRLLDDHKSQYLKYRTNAIRFLSGAARINARGRAANTAAGVRLGSSLYVAQRSA